MSIESVMPSSHLILCHPLLLLPPVPPSIRVFSNESVLCIRWPKYGSFSFSISPSNEHPGLISFRIDWLDLLAVQGTLKSLFSNTTVQKHQFFGAQLYSPALTSIHDYWKKYSFDKWTFVSKLSMLFNMLTMFVIAFFPRSKHLFISWLKPPSAVILETIK